MPAVRHRVQRRQLITIAGSATQAQTRRTSTIPGSATRHREAVTATPPIMEETTTTGPASAPDQLSTPKPVIPTTDTVAAAAIGITASVATIVAIDTIIHTRKAVGVDTNITATTYPTVSNNGTPYLTTFPIP